MTDGLHTGGPIGYAHLNILMSEQGINYVMNLDWKFPVGNGITTDINSGLLRPFKSIFTSGHPPGKTIFLLYENDGSYYVLGSLSRTNQHVIFFPGGNNLEMLNRDGIQVIENSVHIDHFTLDKSFRTWHVTFIEKATKNIRIPQNRTLKINDDLFLWFVVQANSLDSFEKMPKKLQTQLIQTKSEVTRRARGIDNARKDVEFRACQVNDSIPEPHVINFEFFISLNGPPKTDNIKIFYNTPSDLEYDNRGRIPNRVHDVKFPGFSETVSIRVSKFPGSNNAPWNYNSGHVFTNN